MELARRCQICGEGEVTACIQVGPSGGDHGRTFVCSRCASREEALQGGYGVSLSGVAASVAKRQSLKAGADPDKGCPVCGSSLSGIAVDGLLGCGYCYQRFAHEVAESIRTAQGSLHHIGKSPFE